MSPPPALPVTESIRLRPWTADDVRGLYDAVMVDQEHIARWMSWADGDYTLDRADAFIATCLAGYATTTGLLDFAIEVDGAVAGSMGVPRSSREHREYEVGYWLSKPLTGGGIVTRSAGVLTDFLFRERDAHRVQIAALDGNTASRAVAERLGYTFEGLFRQARLHRGQWHSMAWYAITEDEWRARGRDR